MDKANYKDLLEALNHNSYTIIIVVLQNGKFIDWQPAGDYCTFEEAKMDNEWPEDAELILLYGLDALSRFGCNVTPA